MKKKLIIVANNEKLLAYNMITDDLASPATRIEQIEVDYSPAKPDPTGASDDDGCFPGGSTAGQAIAMKHGEPHNRKTEKKKRQLRDLAKAITGIVQQEEYDVWNLSMPESHCQKLIENLPIDVQQKLTRLKKGDYTWLPVKKIEHLFAS